MGLLFISNRVLSFAQNYMTQLLKYIEVQFRAFFVGVCKERMYSFSLLKRGSTQIHRETSSNEVKSMKRKTGGNEEKYLNCMKILVLCSK